MEPIVLFGLLALLVLLVVAVMTLSGLQVIGEDESGLVIRKFGAALPPGHIVALNGEAGYQAEMLPPGWHFGYPWFRFKVVKVPVVRVRPGHIALVVANGGANIPPERILGREVACDKFQDARRFLTGGGEKGRQLGFLTAGTYRINPALFTVITPENAKNFELGPRALEVFKVEADKVGIVTTMDGKPIPAGDLAGAPVEGHDSFQSAQRFLDAGGCRGLQEQVLLSGAWNLNPWFAHVEQIPMTEVPIGYVGVVVSYVGQEHVDVSGDDFTHGDLVERGRKGVWIEPLLPGKHPLNTRVMKVELVPTTNIVLNWAQRTEQHKYDEKLSPITVRSRDGFSFTLDVSQIIHIGMRQAPRVISRVGSMQNLVDHVLQPTVANYFRNSAQQVTVLEFLSARTERQREAYEAIRGALSAYDVECIDTLIGDIQPPAELMKTQTDRKIAEELQRTYEVQREAQMRRRELERETSVANMQGEVVRSEQMVSISAKNALAAAETAKGEAARTRLHAEAEADAMRQRADAEAHALRQRAEAEAAGQRLHGSAEAEATRLLGDAKAEAYRTGVAALGGQAFTAVQLATVLAQHGVKLVPDIALAGGEGGASAQPLLGALVAKMLQNGGTPNVLQRPAAELSPKREEA
ncbi:flotillin family protein [Aggregicoccus sp. 17bor-14]|uniref:SPFH domain-containing protein n=1 Tax=Myxococcaceae TaxID=31 RepID=UPI00129D027A|nr:MULTISPECIES: SPFH domain-containing protein [Myxococcaceae]MBF5042323.1 flotillin family protein [Simulacricoccus sp. 17bor-14]MRI88097.1 flotillin family protein [Aggregicoccus sp. 17bor-14]